MASTVILLLLFTAALLIISRAVPTSSATPRCEDCGSTPVPYPLSTAPNCGDQSYKIRCDAGKLYFNTSNNTYPIISISPETQRLVIRTASFTNDNQTCVTADFPTNGVHLDPTQPFTITSSNTVMFFNCSDALLRSPPPMNCSATSLCHSYTNGSACVAAPICCTFRAGGSYYSIPVSEGGCQAYRSFVNLDHSSPAMSGWPDKGVEIQWVPPPGPRLLPKFWSKPKSPKIGETQEGSSSAAVTEANGPPKKIFTDNNNGRSSKKNYAQCDYNEVTATWFCDLH